MVKKCLPILLDDSVVLYVLCCLLSEVNALGKKYLQEHGIELKSHGHLVLSWREKSC